MQSAIALLNHLPITAILDDLHAHFATGDGVAIVHAGVDTGKTLLLTAALQQTLGSRVLVLQPKRFQVIQAVETLAALSQSKPGVYVDCLLSGVGDRRRQSEATEKLIYTTYGHALASKQIASVDTIILDDVHVGSGDIEVCRAIVKLRLSMGDGLKRVVVMSSHLDPDAEMRYWAGCHPKLFTVPTTPVFRCEHRRSTLPLTAINDLIAEGRRGIAVFTSGIREVDALAADLFNAWSENPAATVEIVPVHGAITMKEYAAVTTAPDAGVVKILLGTDGLESMPPLDWIDAGVSVGSRKELNPIRDGRALDLITVPVTQVDVLRQAGRVTRMRDSVFVLCGGYDMQNLPLIPRSELHRLPPHVLTLRCANMDINPKHLSFYSEQEPHVLAATETILTRLGFLQDKGGLTTDGRFARSLPVGLETAALLCHAKKLGILRDALPLAALAESIGMRKDPTCSHGLDAQSDLIDGVMALAVVHQCGLSQKSWFEFLDRYNVSSSRLSMIMQTVLLLEKTLKLKADYQVYTPDQAVVQAPLMAKLRQCILAASVNHLGHLNASGAVWLQQTGTTPYELSRSTVVSKTTVSQPIAAMLRTITPRNGRGAFAVADGITTFTWEDFEAFDAVRPGVITLTTGRYHRSLSVFGNLLLRLDAAPATILSEPPPSPQIELPVVVHPISIVTPDEDVLPTVSAGVLQQTKVSRSEMLALAARFNTGR